MIIGLGWRLLVSLAMLAALAVMSFKASGPAFDAEALQNIEFRSVWVGPEPVRLTAGEYREATGPESASADTAEIVKLTEQVAFGELNGRQAAAAILVTDPGQSGIQYSFLAIVVEQDGEPLNVATSFLGPWIQVGSIAIEDGDIILDMLIHGPRDQLCCPSKQVTRTYLLQGDRLLLRAIPGPRSQR